MDMKVSLEGADHAVARLCGVKEGDDKIEAAEKVVATMKLAGFSKREINKAQKMVDNAKRIVGRL